MKATMVRQSAQSSYTCNEATVGASVSRHDLSIQQVKSSNLVWHYCFLAILPMALCTCAAPWQLAQQHSVVTWSSVIFKGLQMHMAMACLREIAPVPTACAGGPQGLGSIFWDWVGQGSLWGLSSHAAVVSLSPSAGCAKAV